MPVHQVTHARVAVGDVVEVNAHRVGETHRVGTVAEVLGPPDRPRYRIRWDDGHESVLYPGSDTTVSPRAPVELANPAIEALREAHVEFDVLSHRPTLTAAAEARALGVLPQETAKTVILRCGDGVVRAVVPASQRVALDRVRHILGSHARLASEAELKELYPEFELGAVPPFGAGHDDRVLVDIALCASEYVALPAGTHDRSVRMRTDDLLELAGAELAEIAEVAR